MDFEKMAKELGEVLNDGDYLGACNDDIHGFIHDDGVKLIENALRAAYEAGSESKK